MLTVKGLTIQPDSAEAPVVHQASFRVEKKQIHALLGPNGSGKSTLAYAVMGLGSYRPTAGKIYFLGQDISRKSVTERAKMGITLAWQEPVRFEGITIKDYILTGMANRSEKEVKKALGLVGLGAEKFIHRPVNEGLSGGERKRVELAAVVAMKPKLMILDEPDSGLDIIVYDELYQILDDIRRQTEASILLITHREESGAVADSATLVWEGKTVISGRFAKVMHQYCNLARKGVPCRRIPCPTKS